MRELLTIPLAALIVTLLSSCASSDADGADPGVGGSFPASTGGASASGPAAGTGGSTASGGGSASGGTSSSGSGGSLGGGSATGGGGAGDSFSFFITSLTKMRELSGSEDGFGGDLRFGEATGLAGADKICTTIAESVRPGNARVWRAFLSTSTEDAIDRVGTGPWYDVLGRKLADDVAGLVSADRPAGDAAIANDLPDETGTPLSPLGDYHDILTGSTTEGRLDTENGATCQDWTSAGTDGSPRIGHSFPRSMGGRDGAPNWISDHNAPGCAPGVVSGNEFDTPCVGCSGGYGAIYCFAL